MLGSVIELQPILAYFSSLFVAQFVLYISDRFHGSSGGSILPATDLSKNSALWFDRSSTNCRRPETLYVIVLYVSKHCRWPIAIRLHSLGQSSPLPGKYLHLELLRHKESMSLTDQRRKSSVVRTGAMVQSPHIDTYQKIIMATINTLQSCLVVPWRRSRSR